jgi:hypothetical protein
VSQRRLASEPPRQQSFQLQQTLISFSGAREVPVVGINLGAEANQSRRERFADRFQFSVLGNGLCVTPTDSRGSRLQSFAETGLFQLALRAAAHIEAHQIARRVKHHSAARRCSSVDGAFACDG